VTHEEYLKASRDKWRADAERLREALEQITRLGFGDTGKANEIARAALDQEGEG
jgi:hypothetical protein